MSDVVNTLWALAGEKGPSEHSIVVYFKEINIIGLSNVHAKNSLVAKKLRQQEQKIAIFSHKNEKLLKNLSHV